MTASQNDPARRNAGSEPGATGGGSAKQKIKQDAKDATREAKARAEEKVEAGQHRIAEEADTLSDAIDAAAASFDEHDRQGLARYTREMSSRLSEAAHHLEGRSIDQLADDAKRLARENPALFMLGSIAVGFGLSRFFKASEKHQHRHQSDYEQNDYRQNYGDEGFGPDARSDNLAGGTGFSRSDNGTDSGLGHSGTDRNEPYTSSAADRSGQGRESI
jgi:hypothetical protein